MTRAHINIGSNIGDRHALIELAVARIEAELATSARRATIIESAPWGYESCNAFLNLGITIECRDNMTAMHLFEALQRVQDSIDTSSHRKPDGSYADRAIDIDLIAFGTEVIATKQLTLPHPRMQQRDFVLRPMAELEPQWRHPVTGLTPDEMLARLSSD